jgi:hypothetical protein
MREQIEEKNIQLNHYEAEIAQLNKDKEDLEIRFSHKLDGKMMC